MVHVMHRRSGVVSGWSYPRMPGGGEPPANQPAFTHPAPTNVGQGLAFPPLRQNSPGNKVPVWGSMKLSGAFDSASEDANAMLARAGLELEGEPPRPPDSSSGRAFPRATTFHTMANI